MKFKNIIFTGFLALFSAGYANAQAVTAQDISNLCGLATPCGALIAGIQTGSGTLVPAADNTYDVGTSALGFRSGYFDTSVLTPLIIPPSSLVLRLAADAQRLITFSASNDTGLTQTFGDAGVTALQTFTLRGTTSDADDDSEINIASGGLTGSDRGADIRLSGNEHTNAGQLRVRTGNVAGADYVLSVTDDYILQDQSAAASLSVDVATKAAVFGGAVTSTATGALGWTVVSGANTACNTTCTSACVIGQDAGAANVFVDCATATADTCLCAGGS